MKKTINPTSAPPSPSALSARDAALPRPTDAEVAILRILWDRGPSTVREVHADIELGKDPPPGYTTTLKQMQIMLDKGLITREDGPGRGHVYQASQPAGVTQQQLAGDLLERVFAGSARELVLHALGGRAISTSEIEEIRALLNTLPQAKKPKQ